jgi:hypothetical protein
MKTECNLTTKDLECYIFNCLAKFNPKLRQYKEDALQEIRYAILVGENEMEALRMANRLCEKLMRQYGCVPKQVKERFERYYLSVDADGDDASNNMIEQIRQLYANNHSGREICLYFEKKYNKAVDSLLISAFAREEGGGII